MSDSHEHDVEEGTVTGEDAPERASASEQLPDDLDHPTPDDAESDVPVEDQSPDEVAEPDVDEPEDSLQEQFDALNDRHLRLVAEFTNFRRRAESEMAGAWVRAQADLVRHLLEAFDDLQRVGTWEAETTTVEALVEGVDLVERKFRQALETAGVEAVDPKGEAFDPNTMEAMMRLTTEAEEEDDIVAEVFQKGYLFKGNLVRPARVSVFKRD